jgi:TatD DNase family protein
VMRLFDTHAHMLDKRFDEDREQLIAQMPKDGVVGVIEVGCCMDVSARAAALAQEHDYIYAAVGVHPHDSEDVSGNYISELEELAKHKKVIAIGEIGLDYYYDNSPRDVQRKVFEQQIVLAEKLGLPMIFHMRSSTADMLSILQEHKGIRGVMHCYSGSVETAMICLGLGLHISFTGSVTFKNARKVVDAAAAVPLNRIMAETDCPYLSPEPKRGRRNDPRNVEHVLAKLAEIKDVTFEQMCEINIENAKGLYGI